MREREEESRCHKALNIISFNNFIGNLRKCGLDMSIVRRSEKELNYKA